MLGSASLHILASITKPFNAALGQPRSKIMPSKESVQEILKAQGFTLDSTSGFGDAYKLDLGNGWQVSAYCSFEGNPFAGDVDKDTYEDIDVHLYDMIGTSHICTTDKKLEEKLPDIIRSLRANSDDDEILKCPKCKIRYVNPKTPSEGQKWKPFLSCSGMQIVGRGQNKGVLCDGISKKLPAVVKY
ncbi:hypothetical protein Shew_2731 [Shewanella loihica PV-4]|uniref:Uncharacterized protein n=2 Tax=Shewanella TaxID=22 RepID=A3QGJ9_SHELP|nr:hypothetical protein Shew_2731 [Shewanella loihica PV-4]